MGGATAFFAPTFRNESAATDVEQAATGVEQAATGIEQAATGIEQAATGIEQAATGRAKTRCRDVASACGKKSFAL